VSDLKSYLQCELENLANVVRNSRPATSRDITRVRINASAAGDNVLIPPPSRDLEILAIFLWNGVGIQTLILRDGITTVLQQTNTPIGGGLLLGYAGAYQPHFIASAGNPFILNLSAATQVDGYIHYRLQS
jgi:hypothetical protein